MVGRLIAEVREFVREELFPLERRMEGEGAAVRLLGELDVRRKEVRKRGWWLPHLDASHGGPGLRLAEFARISEELGRSPFGHYVFNCQAPDAGNMEILIEHGTLEQRSRFLEPLLRGEIRSCFAMTEPENPGSNPLELSTTARRDGEDYVLDGHKWFTTGADGAAFAIVMAVTGTEADDPYKRASMIIVPTGTEGYEFVRNIPVMGETGAGWMSHAELRFRACRVPVIHRLGPAGGGFLLAQQRLGPGRIHHAMRWIGIAERALDLTCRHATTRMMGQGRTLAAKQTLRHGIAESRAAIDAARLYVLDTARRIDEEGSYTCRIQVSALKFHVAGVLQRVLDRAVQAHGALGLTDATPLAFWYRHERAARIYDGPDEVHKERVAREVLKAYADA